MFGSSETKRREIDEIVIIIGALKRFIFHIEKADWDNDSRWDFDDHMRIKFEGKRAESVRRLVWQVSSAFPGEGSSVHSQEGTDILGAILAALRKERAL